MPDRTITIPPAHAIMIATSGNPYAEASRLGHGTLTADSAIAVEDWFTATWHDRLKGNPDLADALNSGDPDAVQRVLDSYQETTR